MAWPANSWRRAAMVLAENDSGWREAMRARSDRVITGAGTFSVRASSTVHRPSPGPAAPAVATREVRLLEGPNLSSPRPAVKVTLTLPGYLAAPPEVVRAVCGALGLRRGQPGAEGSAQRQQAVVRVVERAARLLVLELEMNGALFLEPGSAEPRVVRSNVSGISETAKPFSVSAATVRLTPLRVIEPLSTT